VSFDRQFISQHSKRKKPISSDGLFSLSRPNIHAKRLAGFMGTTTKIAIIGMVEPMIN
jgi:hypothetical protein